MARTASTAEVTSITHHSTRANGTGSIASGSTGVVNAGGYTHHSGPGNACASSTRCDAGR